MRALLAILLATLAWAVDTPLPTAPAGVPELHGTLGGARFWARLSAAKAEFGGDRMLELVYTPPAPAQLGGAILVDCPFLLLDANLRLVAWNGRDGLSKAIARPDGYHVTRELEGKTIDGAAPAPTSAAGIVAGGRGWDERTAPVLLALAWRRGSAASVPCYDLFAQSPVASAASWDGDRAVIAGRQFRVTADDAGRLLRLDDAAGNALLTVTSWIQTTP